MSAPNGVNAVDFFCADGGASMGYHRAGMTMKGVDNAKRRKSFYPFELVKGDAFELMADPDFMSDVVFAAASPPCKGYTPLAHLHKVGHPRMIGEVRRLLEAWGGPYVIENVMGARSEMRDPIMLCGSMFGLADETTGRILRRHRLFESNVPLVQPECSCSGKPVVGVYGNGGAWKRKAPGGGGTKVVGADAARVLGIDWHTSQTTLSQAIPPAYTEYIGRQVMDYLAGAR